MAKKKLPSFESPVSETSPGSETPAEVSDFSLKVPDLSSEKKSLRNIGRLYSGYDGAESIEVPTNAVVKVSAEKAKQLLTDFPENWTEV